MDFWLYKQAQQNGHHIAITDGQESYTYQIYTVKRVYWLKDSRLINNLVSGYT